MLTEKKCKFIKNSGSFPVFFQPDNEMCKVFNKNVNFEDVAGNLFNFTFFLNR